MVYYSALSRFSRTFSFLPAHHTLATLWIRQTCFAHGIAMCAISSHFNRSSVSEWFSIFTGGCASLKALRRVAGAALAVSIARGVARADGRLYEARKSALSDRYAFSHRCAACATNARCNRHTHGAAAAPFDCH